MIEQDDDLSLIYRFDTPIAYSFFQTNEQNNFNNSLQDTWLKQHMRNQFSFVYGFPHISKVNMNAIFNKVFLKNLQLYFDEPF